MDIDITNKTTRKAWEDNWKGVSMSEILGMFTLKRVMKLKEAVISNFPVGDIRILEAGCGLAPWVIEFERMGYDISGVDYQKSCMEKVRSFDKKVKIAAGDVRELPYKDGSFDVYLSFGVIEHFAEGPAKVLDEAFRVLRRKGRLILSVPFNNIFLRVKSPVTNMKRSPMLRKIFGKPARDYYYQRYFSVNGLRDCIERPGFSVKDIFPVDHIFSLVEFSDIFRDKNVFDGENALAVRTAGWLEKLLPWQSAGAIMCVAEKR